MARLKQEHKLELDKQITPLIKMINQQLRKKGLKDIEVESLRFMYRKDANAKIHTCGPNEKLVQVIRNGKVTYECQQVRI